MVHGFDSDDEDLVPATVTSNVARKTVRVRGGLVEPIICEKPDFVKCTKSKPRDKNHNKTGKTAEEIRKDENWSFAFRLASSRAKAMAIILDKYDDAQEIDEVLIVVGPQVDIRIRLDTDDNGEPVNQVFIEEYVPHVPGRYEKKGCVMCIAVPVEEKDKKFIIDSGSGHDLIAAKKVGRMDLPMYDDDVVSFHTANGVTVSTKKVDIGFEAFDEVASLHVLEDTPSVLTMGKRCLEHEHGYSFVWPAGKNPYMIDKDGNFISMNVKDSIPYK